MTEENWVTLDEYQWAEAIAVGARRVISSHYKGLTHRHDMSPDTVWQANIEGAAGECAAALFLGYEWEKTVDTFRTKADLCGNIEVKTRASYTYSLLIRPWDMENLTGTKLFVHVTGRSPSLQIQGWVSSDDVLANHEKWWGDGGLINNDRPKDLWLIPNSDLRTDWEEFSRQVTHD